MEMVKGEHSLLVSGAKSPEIIVERDEFTKALKYSARKHEENRGIWEEDLQDEPLRKTILNTLLAIPHTESTDTAQYNISRQTEFTPGYYEFTLVRKKENAPLEPVFIDYRRNPVYQLA